MTKKKEVLRRQFFDNVLAGTGRSNPTSPSLRAVKLGEDGRTPPIQLNLA